MFSSYLPVHHNICRPKCWSSIKWVWQVHMCLLLYKYFRLPEYIKKDIPSKVMFVFEVGKLLITNNMLSNCIQTRLTTNMTHLINGNNGIMGRYRMIVRYYNDDIYWPNPTIRIAKRKFGAFVACKHAKTTFYIVVMSNFTSISWTFLQERTLVKPCHALGRTISLLVKLLYLKSGTTPQRPSMILSK